MNKETINYQIFQWEFGSKENILELAFTYMLKCFYFPKYMRLEWLKYYQDGEGEFPWNKLSEEEWKEIEKNHYWDYLDHQVRKITPEFIRYAVLLTPNDGKKLNYLTQEQAEQVQKALELVPKEWKKKRPWYPLSYCDIALDDCLIEVKWSDKKGITGEVRKLDRMINNDYEFWSLQRGGIYFASTGKLLIADVLGNCEIIKEDFKERKISAFNSLGERDEKNLELKSGRVVIIILPEKPSLKRIPINDLISVSGDRDFPPLQKEHSTQ